MGQIPHSTERISSFYYICTICHICTAIKLPYYKSVNKHGHVLQHDRYITAS